MIPISQPSCDSKPPHFVQPPPGFASTESIVIIEKRERRSHPNNQRALLSPRSPPFYSISGHRSRSKGGQSKKAQGRRSTSSPRWLARSRSVAYFQDRALFTRSKRVLSRTSGVICVVKAGIKFDLTTTLKEAMSGVRFLILFRKTLTLTVECVQ